MALIGETLTLDEADAQEVFFQRGWTDGLPVVPPTRERVGAMLRATTSDPETVIGAMPERNRSLTLHMAATNAVLAGCKPEYFPLVLAALEAVFDPGFNLNVAITSTSSMALTVIVSGPMAAEVEMNARAAALGSGNRANATIGRALMLIARNVLGAVPGVTDASAMGQPGKFTSCFAEDPPPQPWEPLRTTLGYSETDTTVTVAPTESLRQLSQTTNGSAEGMLKTFAAAIKSPGYYSSGKRTQALVVLSPQHAQVCVEAGWTQPEVREYLYRESRVSRDELLASGVLVDKSASFILDDDGLLPSVGSADSVLLVTAGGWGNGWSAYAPVYLPSATRRVRPVGEPLPSCGPDGCSVNGTS